MNDLTKISVDNFSVNVCPSLIAGRHSVVIGLRRFISFNSSVSIDVNKLISITVSMKVRS